MLRPLLLFSTLAALLLLLLLPLPARALDPGQAKDRYTFATQGDFLADMALTRYGDPYLWGGSSPRGFDCSGLVAWVYRQAGIVLPRTVHAQLRAGRQLPASELHRGDIVIFANTYRSGPSHSGIYIGYGQFIHAASFGTGVTISSLSASYWAQRFVAGVRPWSEQVEQPISTSVFGQARIYAL